MKLYGSHTSPFARRARIVAAEVGAPLTFVDTMKEEGQAALRAVSPIWKIPVADVDGLVILDSHAIIEYLLEAYGTRNLRVPSGPSRWAEKNTANVIDGALEAAINVFYLKRDGADPEAIGYLVKQRARVESAMDWLERRLDDGWFSAERRLGLTEIYLATTLDWMSFRDVYPVARHPGFVRFRETHRAVPSLLATLPHP